MDRNELKVKQFVTKVDLPAICGPSCVLWDAKNRRCKATDDIRDANANCTEGFTDTLTRMLNGVDWTKLTVDRSNKV